MLAHDEGPPWGWVVFGLGRAARARCAALEAEPSATLRRKVSRRRGLGDGTWREALADPEIHCVAICTENADHPGRVEASLEAGKHVLVEYPLAPTSAEAARLYQLAVARGCHLHVGLIGLLSEGHAAVAAAISSERVYRMEVALTGDFGGWIAAEARAGRYGQLAISRLHALWDWMGPLTLHRATRLWRPDGYTLTIELWDTRRRLHRICERRDAGASRRRTVSLVDPRGEPIQVPAATARGGVFERDVASFSGLLRGESPRVRHQTVLDVLALAEEVSLRVGTPC